MKFLVFLLISCVALSACHKKHKNTPVSAQGPGAQGPGSGDRIFQDNFESSRADVNGDGIMDRIETLGDGSTIIYLGQPDGTFILQDL